VTPALIGLLSLTCTLIGIGISKLWLMAVEFTTIREQLAKAKQDTNNLGILVRKNDTKQERRNKQILSALIDTHAENPNDVKRLASLLRDDSWD
jgi:hypothetical protein